MRYLIVGLMMLLTGCFGEKHPQGPDAPEIIASLNAQITPRCIVAPLKGLYFNTSARTYDAVLQRFETTPLPAISVRRQPSYQKTLDKMMVLVSLGLFSIDERTSILMNSNYQERQKLYYVGDFEADNGAVKPTSGARFMLTDLGKRYIKTYDQYGNLGICTGYHSVQSIGRPHKDQLFDAKSEGEITRLHLSFNTELMLSHDFMNDTKLQQAFPDIQEVISRNQTGYGLFSVKKQNGQWQVEPKSVLF